MTITLEERVANGVRFLDDTMPDWRTVMSGQPFDMSSTETCVLGQLFGWQEGVERLYEWSEVNLDPLDCMPLVEASGFEKTDETYLQLGLAWLRVIANGPECDGCDQDPWRAPVHYGTCPLAVPVPA